MPSLAPGEGERPNRHPPDIFGADVLLASQSRLRAADDLEPQANTRIVDLGPERDDGYDLTDWILDLRSGHGGLDLTRLLDEGGSHGV